jgi:hypothetical protein
MELVKRDNTQTLPLELIELVMRHFSSVSLTKLYIQSIKYNPNFAHHIKVVINKNMRYTFRTYIFHVYNTISFITTRRQYVNTIATFHNIKLIDNKEKKQIKYIKELATTIENQKERRKFENLTSTVGKYC